MVCIENGTVYTDQNLLRCIITNFVANAICYSDHGLIEITTEVKNKKVIVQVKDQGEGIPQQELENIFSEYHQLSNPERDRNKGLGLGLSIVKRLCELLQIDLLVDSKKNYGSCFSIALKESYLQPEEVILDQKTLAHKSLNKTILVVEDDVDILYGMGALLKKWGCKPLLTTSIHQAISLLVDENIETLDFIIADYRLRENTTGIEAIQQIRTELNQDVPSVIITGDTKIKETSISKERLSILYKPIKVDRLYEILKQYSLVS